MSIAAAFLSGLVFGVGLIVGGMTDPSKVIGFLSFFDRWDPSLMMVLGGAVGTHLVLYRLIRLRPAPLLDARFHVPTRRDIDPRLVLGAVLFGVGWGLAGYCPGPGIVGAVGGGPALVFAAAMIAGMFAFRAFERAATRRPVTEPVVERQPEGSR